MSILDGMCEWGEHNRIWLTGYNSKNAVEIVIVSAAFSMFKIYVSLWIKRGIVSSSA